MKGIIYKITSPTNRSYVGQTIKESIEKRYKYGKVSKSQTKLYRSVKKHGWDLHKKEILETVFYEDPKILDEREIYWIEKLNCIERGLNCRNGGNTPGFSTSTRRKISEGNKGKKLSDEHRKKISESLNITNQDPLIKEIRKKGGEKARLTRIANGNNVSSLKGKKLSEEDKMKKSIAAKNRIKIECPHCDMITDPGNAKRFHFDNCKFKNISTEERLKILEDKNKPKIKIRVTCPHCQKIMDPGNAKKSHFDNCKLNSKNTI